MIHDPKDPDLTTLLEATAHLSRADRPLTSAEIKAILVRHVLSDPYNGSVAAATDDLLRLYLRLWDSERSARSDLIPPSLVLQIGSFLQLEIDQSYVEGFGWNGGSGQPRPIETIRLNQASFYPSDLLTEIAFLCGATAASLQNRKD